MNSHIEKVRDLLPSGEINGVSDYFRIGISDDVCIS